METTRADFYVMHAYEHHRSYHMAHTKIPWTSSAAHKNKVTKKASHLISFFYYLLQQDYLLLAFATLLLSPTRINGEPTWMLKDK
jgi:hypothetical protein